MSDNETYIPDAFLADSVEKRDKDEARSLQTVRCTLPRGGGAPRHVGSAEGWGAIVAVSPAPEAGAQLRGGHASRRSCAF